MIEALQEASPTERKAFFEGMGAGFFLAPVVQKVKADVITQ